MADVMIILGSKSDQAIADKATRMLEELGISYSLEVASAHRNPEKLEKLVSETDVKLFIAIAGLSAALPGTVAAKTIRPVIAVPVDAKLGGLDALLSCVQMPPGIPTATVGIDNGKNAALLAAGILSISDGKVAESLNSFREAMK